MQNLSNTSKTTISQSSALFTPELLAASGTLAFSMTNDYLFRAVFQESPKALKGLISSLLHIPPKEIFSVEITNPILPGAALGEKEIRLDINLILNNMRIINLEMQLEYRPDWHDRSLVYLCRNADKIAVGKEYTTLMPIVHIGILDSVPAGEGTEFYSRNMLTNVKTGKIYNDKLVLCMLNLSQIQNATDEDKTWGIDRWAKLLRAKTWEEIKMISNNDEYLEEAAKTLLRMSSDYTTQKIAQDREDYYRDLRTWKRQLADRDAALQEKDTMLAEQQDIIIQQQSALTEKDTLIAELQTQLAIRQSE